MKGPSPEQRDSRLTSGRLLARNTYISFIGQGAPILVAVFAIPLLIDMLGTERFGVLALAWVVMGYFGLFDFGLGRATTKFVAEYRARGELEDLPELIWSSVVFHIVLGLLGGVILGSLIPWLTSSVLNTPNFLLSETRAAFYLLAASVPLVVTTAALRGVLEAMQRFDLTNAVKIPASTINYLGPLPILFFVDSLVAVVGFLVVSRGVVLLAYLLLCLRTVPALSQGFRFSMTRMKPLVGFGSWLTISSFFGPTISSIDRVMIGSLVSLSAVTVYVVPYEVVTKLIIFATSLLTVLFPAFSSLAVDRSWELRRLYGRALKYLLVLVAPIVGMLLALSGDLLSLWVGAELAQNSAPIAKWLAVGVLANILAQVPFTLLQGIGRADLTAKLQVAQLPFYALIVFYLLGLLGITGVAVAWALRATVEAAMLLFAADRLLPASREETGKNLSVIVAVPVFLLLFLGVGLAMPNPTILKVGIVALLLGIFVFCEWVFFLEPKDREAFIGGAKSTLRVVKSMTSRSLP